MTGVSAQRELIERAVAEGAELVLVHHGLFWDFHPTGADAGAGRAPATAVQARHRARRATTCRSTRIPSWATTRSWPSGSAASATRRSRATRARPIGRAGTFPGDGIPAAELFARVRELTARVPTVFDGGPERVRRIGIVSGGGARLSRAGDRRGARRVPHRRAARARDGTTRARPGIHFIAAGHYATETFGVRALGDWLAERFGIEHVWVDIPNPV